MISHGILKRSHYYNTLYIFIAGTIRILTFKHCFENMFLLLFNLLQFYRGFEQIVHNVFYNSV